MNTIKNLHKIADIISPDKLMELDKAANLHLRHSNIEFKIIGVSGNVVTLRTSQGKHISENYATEAVLVTRTKELFERYIPGYVPLIHPVTYKLSAVEIVTPKWIAEKMLKQSLKIKTIQADTGIDKTNLSAWINGVRPMSQPVKAMFYYYFKDNEYME